MTELDFIDQLKALATHPAARGLADDAAVLPFGRHKLVMTHDMMVEDVHFLSSADPADVAWKLVAVNLSDLAAKGAKPLGMLMGYCQTGDDNWDTAFVRGLKEAIGHFCVPLLGGDTVSAGADGKRTLALTAFGEAKGHIIPARCGAEPGHSIYVTGHIGDAWAGLQIASGKAHAGDIETSAALLKAHNRPVPKLDDGRALSSLVSTMMDVSDGLLLDASRIASASGVNLEIDLDQLPLSQSFKTVFGEGEEARMSAATGGDDYQLLLTASPETVLPINLSKIGKCRPGSGVSLVQKGERIGLPETLGFVHA
ncbi:thiamine-phosphate kinase [Parasphingorhabdus cellanae]|uniref:Thiamine-monophosphate kinase n=1 Tax=Parasphingorhabdus cellanae TaxID=2806553 RepID=A0ABX7T5J1_9SPHN|nr:thiamine-phosphate kinase [Parasphingorhabdus cellanae]QTD55515.1 thiamine-phosphate kinase [Parasphingorhabdus cellanae]